MPVFHNLAHFLRWRLIPVRYLGKIAAAGAPTLPPRTSTIARVTEEGHAPGHTVPPELIAEIQAIYRPRIAAVVPKTSGHPFVNLLRPEDIGPENPILRLAFSSQVLDVASEYFGGNLVLDSIQPLYSWPTPAAALANSQMWHKDYGDTKSFHWICYLSDVDGPDDGPFGYVDKMDTRRIRASAFIRRIDDKQFERELGDGRQREFLGPAGSSLFMDPAVCYHYGSRCRNGRFALFVTFNTHRPFVGPTDMVRENGPALFEAARRLRPDLNEQFLRGILRLQDRI